ncbi:hypothetical protein HPB48_012674 [Haemaphysalis longicornis]|uniref:Ionotropic receptor n=1 Tax=Haemaphysalis longicornis TaxID=44386 RepID=A0A9J6G230_HAELO|nr:hypothetical protein HPB48_012674 [Haemaphysalis longicornis]
MKAALTVREDRGGRINSAADLAAREDVKLYMLRGPAYPLLLALSPRPHDRLVYRKLKPWSLVPYTRLWTPFVLDQVANGKAVIIADRVTLTYQAAKACQNYPDTEFYIGRENVISHPMVFYYNRLRLPQVFKLWEERIVRVQEMGIFSKWKAESLALRGDFSRCPKAEIGEADTLDFVHHRSIFLLWLGGIALAGVVLLVELLLGGQVARACGYVVQKGGRPGGWRRHAARVQRIQMRQDH